MYQPNITSLRKHTLPTWFSDAKFGIFIHWGLYSVPAYAPTRLGDINELFRTRSEAFVYANQPYAEWYCNSLRIPDSPVYRYHQKVYGSSFDYEDFASDFNKTIASWDPLSWTELFKRAGARYVVLVTKHHDGFLLWESTTHAPSGCRKGIKREKYQVSRDVVGELSHAIRSAGIRMGYYYSSALDWSFTSKPILGLVDLLTSGPTDHQYIKYMESHWRELIYRYKADILWNDIAYPAGSNLNVLFAEFYNHNPEGVVNDRWLQIPKFMATKTGRWAMRGLLRMMKRQHGTEYPKIPHFDFRTAEYFSYPSIQKVKWEANRGIGHSFGYNREEKENDYLTADQLIIMLIDTVSKNGNLLLNVGPRADGSVHEAQARALEGLGKWLAVNGEAIYDSRPWARYGDLLSNGVRSFYTCKNNVLYVFILNLGTQKEIFIPDLAVSDGCRISILENHEVLDWERIGENVKVKIPVLPEKHVHVIKIEGITNA